ncbi:MAG TPA: FtsX-like permease family protein [Pirellulaceae bacterium]|nr:FtsX-like permease family protein [Pirellulaceae bacterium]
MTSWTLLVRSLFFFRRVHMAVALGVAAATAVLVGALLVGDSVRGSLRQLTLDRLGQIDELLVTDRFFRAELATELKQTKTFEQHYSAIAPAILFPSVTLEKTTGESSQAANVLAMGVDESFWKLGKSGDAPARLPGDNEIVLNQTLADALAAHVGDEVVLRLPAINQVPADSPLGKKADRIRSLAGLKVIAIVPAESLGRFALRPSQSPPRNAYLNTRTLQDFLKKPDQVNSLLIAGSPDEKQPPAAEISAALANDLTPSLADFGVRVDRVRRTFTAPNSTDEQVIYDYLQVTTDRMIFTPQAQKVIDAALAPYHPQPVLTYLANTIAKGDAATGVPYSTISAVDSIAGIGPALLSPTEPVRLQANEIALNQWAADDLEAKLGDTIRIAYFAPETSHGVAIEKSATFKLAAIVPLTEPVIGFRRKLPAKYNEPPTTANDPDLTPVVEGVTDQASIADWDPPFPFDQKRVRSTDDSYWENHRTTPKAFLSFAAGEKLWGSRFGDVTSYRIPATADVTLEQLQGKLLTALRAEQTELGFTLLPVKRQGLAASSGTTPFDVLFLFLSFFVIAAALMLVAVLFKLGVQQRVRELGTLLSLGWTRRQTRRLWLLEAVQVAGVGAALGVVLGIAYAWLMLAGLRSWWLGAITTPFLTLHITPRSLLIGLISGLVISSLTIALSLRRLFRLSTRELLSGQTGESRLLRKRSALWNWLSLALVLIALALAALATTLGGEAQAGAFVGAGAAVLTAILLLLWNQLRSASSSNLTTFGLSRLAWAAAQRNPSRSTLTIGLVAAASFLIVAMSSFRLSPTLTGAGGFDLVATTSEPIFADLNSPEGRQELLDQDAKQLAGATVLGLRLLPGDDASCSNLYQAQQPRVLGITPALVRHYNTPENPSFAWAGSAASSPQQASNPWELLNGPAVGDNEPIPVVLDKNTAMYSLHLYRGIGEEFTVTYDDGPPVKFKVVGLLSNSILQGSLMIGEADFVRQFPAISGYRYFLVQAPTAELPEVTRVLRSKLSDQGFDAESTTALLTSLLAVQNTYLSTFQSLGALGLLLGTFGLATVQWRSVLERRGELALLRAAGFRSARLARLVLTESVLLLLCGLGTGVLAALIAVLPHMIFGGASIPFADLAIMLGVVLVAGLLTSLLAVRAMLRADIIGALRGE